MATIVLEVDRSRPDQTFEQTLDGVNYRLRFFYRQRTGAWYMDLRTADDEGLLLGTRISPGINAKHFLDRGDYPPGDFVFQGVDPYERGDERLIVTYVEASDIPAPVDDPAVGVEI